MKQIVLRFVLFIFFITPIFAQNSTFRFSHITSKEGLPHSLVFCFAQDQQGFIWVGTNNGLARFDGYDFKVYQPNILKKNTIGDKSVNKLHCDRDGNLWIGLQGKGLNKMNLKTEKFYSYFPDKKNPNNLSGNDIRQIIEDIDGKIWILTNKGIDQYDEQKDCFIHFLPKQLNNNSFPNSDIARFVFDNNKNIWFQSGHGIGFLDIKSLHVTTIGKLTANDWLDNIYIFDLIADKSGNLWFSGGTGGLFYYNIKTNTLERYLTNYINVRYLYFDKNEYLFVYVDRPANKLIVLPKEKQNSKEFSEFPMFDANSGIDYFSIAEDFENNIWITSTQGLEKFSFKSGITHFRNNKSIGGTLSGNNLVTSFVDRSDNLWLSVYRIGIDKADLLQKPFKWYVNDPENKNGSLPGNDITSVYEDREGKIWIGTFATGLTCFNPKNQTYITIPVKLGDPTKINYNAPSAMYEDDRGKLWVGYHDGQLDVIDTKTLKFEQYRDNLPTNSRFYFSSFGIRKIIPDKDGNLWIASSRKGLVEYNIKSKRFIYHSEMYEKDFLSNIFYRTAYITRDEIIWTGTQNGGLIGYDKYKKQFISYKTDPTNPYSINNNTVYAIYEDENTNMWIGTATGLNRFDRNSRKFYKYAQFNELMQYGIYSIYPDNAGNLWMSTDHGVLSFNPNKLILKTFTENDGLPSNEFSTTGHCKIKSGEIFFGSAKGLVSFNPQDIKTNPHKTKPILTELKIFNKIISPGDSLNKRVVLHEHIWNTKKLELNYFENDFQLKFSALQYATPENITFYYKLENFNENWQICDSYKNFAIFTGIQPGNYTFKLKTTNRDGIPSEVNNEISLLIIIKPPFWKTFLFKIASVLFIILLILYYIKIRLTRLRLQKKKLEQLVKERTRGLEEINVMLEEKQEEINIQNEELISQRENLAEANQKLTEQQKQILEQNTELNNHRDKLELLIYERTAELLDAKTKAEDADRLKSSFISNMSHEIRTPMNAIIGFASLLRDNLYSPEELNNIYNIIISNGESLLVLINDILDLSFIQTGQMKLKLDYCRMKEFLTDIYVSHARNFNNKPVELKLSINNISDSLLIYTDSIRLRQVFDNLIGNATKFTSEGNLTFGIKSIEKEITFFVTDTGIGIPSDVEDKIFDRFTKIENQSETLFRGTGLGLAICKSIVELWNGRIWYTSELNKGTTFYFTHPINVRKNEDITLPDNDSKTDNIIVNINSLKNKIILIAEDEEYNFQVIAAYFKETKASIHWVKNGKEAIDFIHNTIPDIVLMDIKMPVLDGTLTTKLLRKSYPDLKIIAQTAYARSEEIENFMAAGFNDYLIKPFKKEELLAIIQKNLEK